MLKPNQNQKEDPAPDPAPNQSAYACAVCGLSYNDKATAEACRSWCKQHSSCNLKIIKQAIEETL